MSRVFVPETGFRRPWFDYQNSVQPGGMVNPEKMNPFIEVMRRSPDPEMALRKHSEFKKPWEWKEVNIMELSLERKPWELPGWSPYPGLPDIKRPEIVFPEIVLPEFPPFVVPDIPPVPEIPSLPPIEPPVIKTPYPKGQPAVPSYSPMAFISWVVWDWGGVTWGYVGNLVLYNYGSYLNFADAADLFSRMMLEPNPGWKQAGTGDLDYFNVSESNSGDRRGGAMAGYGGSDKWGISRPITDGINRLRVYWGINSPPGTSNNIGLITPASIRDGCTLLKIDGKEYSLLGKSVRYIESIGGGQYHVYWELNRCETRWLYDDEIGGSGTPSDHYASGYARLDVTGKYGLWADGEHSD